MKKVLVILTILILVASSIFAAENYVVRVTTQVESKNPTFILKAGISPDSFDRESDDSTMNMLGWEAVDKSILNDNVVVYFQIAQKGVAKGLGKKFALSIEASEMVLELNEDGSPLAPETEIHKTAKGNISNFSANNDEKNIAVALSGPSTNDAVNLLAEYRGVVYDGTPIATFTVTWAKDVTAPDGIYQASVILKVSPQ